MVIHAQGCCGTINGASSSVECSKLNELNKENRKLFDTVKEIVEKKNGIDPKVLEIMKNFVESVEKLGEDVKIPFSIELACNSFKNLMKKTKNGFRFTPAIYAYAYNIRFKGGEGVLNDIRGKSRGTGNAIDIYDLNIPLPSVNSLLNHSYPINYDPNPDNFNTRRILDGIPEEIKKNSLFLLAADEISIQPQLVHINNYGLVGLVVDCYEKNISAFVELHKEDQIYKKLATEVMQIMLISIDGKCATPLSFIYTRKANQKVTKDYFIQLIKLEREGINVIGGTTDGYLDTSFQGSMNKEYKEYLHFYDFIHLLKRFRNCLTKNTSF